MMDDVPNGPDDVQAAGEDAPTGAGATAADAVAQAAVAAGAGTSGAAGGAGLGGGVDDRAGEGIVRGNLVGTLLFAAVSFVGAAVTAFEVPSAVFGVVLFAVGVATFIWSYVTALERSRTEELGVANLYLLTGRTAPPRVKRLMMGALYAQIVICLVAAWAGFSRLEGDNDLNPAAFTILGPMFGLGLNGLWASRHGAFGPRILSPSGGRPSRRRPPSRAATPDSEHS